VSMIILCWQSPAPGRDRTQIKFSEMIAGSGADFHRV
jgi:hypothetical protein